MRAFSTWLGWDEHSESRLMLACEESMLYLLERRASREPATARVRVHIICTAVEDEAEVELICTPANVNFQTAIATLPKSSESDLEADLSLRLLRAMTRDNRHMLNHGIDSLTLRVASHD